MSYSSDWHLKREYRAVPTLTDRDGIPAEIRVEGMLCYVVENTKTYRLEADLVTWTETAGGGGISSLTEDVEASGAGAVPAKVVAIQNHAVYGGAPSDEDLLVYHEPLDMWIPGVITQDMIRPGFAISSFTVSETLVEVGRTVDLPHFTASYTGGPAVSATCSDGGLNAPISLSGLTLDAWDSPYSYTYNTYPHTVTFSLDAVKGTKHAYASRSCLWGANVYMGVADPGLTGETFVKSLSTQWLTNTPLRSFTTTAAAGKKIYYCYPSSDGQVSFWAGGFQGGFIRHPEVANLTNGYGVSMDYYIWESTTTGLGTVTITVAVP